MKYYISILAFLLFFSACKKENIGGNDSDKFLKIKFEFSPDQQRLNNIGESANMPVGHAGQTPDFKALSVHFIELVPERFTPYKSGATLHAGEEVAADNANPFGFTTAINFEKALIFEGGEVFIEVPISDIPPGDYKHVRVSVAYQKYDVNFNLKNVPAIGDLDNQSGTLASFLGYNVFLKDVEVRKETLPVNDFKLQGFWAFESNLSDPWSDYNRISFGESPGGGTTVVNPFPESPIPPGSCVVSGSLDKTISISETALDDINLSLSFSINKSFEWQDTNGNGEWDLNASEPQNSEKVVDMGLRGLIGKVD